MSGGVNKFRAKRTPCNQGHTHASGKEARRCNDLHLMQCAGAISHLRVEPQFWFVIDGVQVKHGNGRRVGYKPDFQYFEGAANVVEDVKSSATKTEAYTLRKAIFLALHPYIELREV